MGKYATVIKRVFETEAEANGVHQELTFTREDIDEAVEATGVEICCPPDIPYAYRAGRHLPETIAGHGFRDIEIADESEQGSPVYKFAR